MYRCGGHVDGRQTPCYLTGTDWRLGDGSSVCGLREGAVAEAALDTPEGRVLDGRWYALYEVSATDSVKTSQCHVRQCVQHDSEMIVALPPVRYLYISYIVRNSSSISHVPALIT